MEPRLIIALDPGGTTGLDWCHRQQPLNSLKWAVHPVQIAPCHTSKALKELLAKMTSLVGLVEPLRGMDVTVICENFEHRPFETRDRIDYTPAEVIGAVRAWCIQYEGVVTLVRATASMGKGFWTDDKIKQSGLWVPGKKHAMDARRHLLRYRSFILGHKELYEPLRPPASEASKTDELT